MCASEDDKVVCGIALCLAFRIEGIARDDKRGKIRGTTALTGDSAGKRTVKAVVFGKSASCGLFDDGQCW